MNARRLTIITAIGLTLVSLLASSLGGYVLVNAITRSNERIQLANNAEYGRRFASALEAQIRSSTSEDEVLRFLQASFTSSPGDDHRYICVLNEDGEVLCHPREEAIGAIPSITPLVSPPKADPSVYIQLVESGELEGYLTDSDGHPFELVRRIPVEGAPWQVLVHTNLDALNEETRHLARTIAAVMIPTGILFVLFGTLVVRTLGRRYEAAIEEANTELELHVDARTEELRDALHTLQQTRNELQMREKMALVGQLLSGITHEIRTPLTAISLHAQSLEEEAQDDASLHSARAIKRSADRCEALVRNLLAFARQESPQRTTAPLRSLIDNAVANAEPDLQAQAVALTVSLPNDLDSASISVDQLQIEQVLVNLLQNAVQAPSTAQTPRKVQITVEKTDAVYTITVEDNGNGVADSFLPHLFQPFHTTKGLGKGTGLGLSLCRQFIEAHGGNIQYERSRLLGGACFRIHLPATC